MALLVFFSAKVIEATEPESVSALRAKPNVPRAQPKWWFASTMHELREEHSLGEMEALASQARMGARFRVFTSALPIKFVPDCMGAYTYQGCSHYIAKRRRFCRRLVGVRRGLFADDAPKKCHAGPCSTEGLQFYRFILQLKDESGTCFAVIGDAAAYLFGSVVPLPAHDFATLSFGNKTRLLQSQTARKLFFHLQFSMSHKGVGSWSVLKVSQFPLHTLITPPPSEDLSSPVPEGSSTRLPRCERLDGSPLTRLLNMQPRQNPLNGLPPDTWSQSDRKHLVFALYLLQFVSVALKQASEMVDSAIERIAAYLEHGGT